MKTDLRNIEAQAFLNDFEKNSKTMILEEGVKTSELAKIAKAKGLDIKSKDLGFFKSIYAFTDKANDNGAILPEKKLLKVLPQIIGKPININHSRDKALGHYIDYKYIASEKKILAYGVFYKTYFGELWDEAKDLFKKKALSMSFEIWSPEETRKKYKDGTYELTDMEMAGGALVYEDTENQPAFKDAKVLQLAQQLASKSFNPKDLVFATSKKYKEEEIITSKTETEKAENEVVQKPQINQDILKITCANCGEESEHKTDIRYKCPSCYAIMDKEGTMIYPPQIKDFSMSCPSCQTNNWLITSKAEDNAQIKCSQCSKEYKITFNKQELPEHLKGIGFVRTTEIRCPQCGKYHIFSGIVSQEKSTIKCKRCGLTFPFDIKKSKKYKNISSIEEVIIDKKDEKPENTGGKKMELKDKKVEEKVQKAEAKKSENPTEEASKKEAPKSEENKTEDATENKVVEKEPEVVEKAEKETPEISKESEIEEKTEEVVENKESKEESKTEDSKDEKVEETKEEPKVEKYPKTKILRKAVSKIKELKKNDGLVEEVKKLKEAVKKVTKLLKKSRSEATVLREDALKIVRRREELGDFKKDEITDIQLADDTIFEKAKSEKEELESKATQKEEKPLISTKKQEDKDAETRNKVDLYIAQRLEKNKKDLKDNNINVE